jgi:hypothetical protein
VSLQPGGSPEFDRPIFIVSTPRSGSTLLFEALELAPGLFSTGRESHQLIEGIGGLHPSERGWDSNRLERSDATAERTAALQQAFAERLRDRDGSPAAGPSRMLEKTPKNAVRVPFLDAAFPDSIFVYLYRDPRETLGSMIEAWLSGAFRTYPQLPGWTGYPWSLLLVPGWRALIGKALPNIVAAQWATTTELLVHDLSALPRERLVCTTYAELIANPQRTIERLTSALDLGWDRKLEPRLPRSKTALTRPAPGKWRRWEQAIEAVVPMARDADSAALDLLRNLAAS